MSNLINVTQVGGEYVVSGNFNGTMAELCEAIESAEKENEK